MASIDGTMGKKVYFISDSHLGSGDDSRARERELCALLDRIAPDCGCLLLLGDVFDFWFSYRHLVPRGHVRLLGQLARMHDEGVEIHFFLGNHDMWVFDYLTAECGAVVHADPTVMEFGGRRFLVGHGDGLGGEDPWFDFVRHFFRSRLCQALFAALPAGLTFPIARRWSDSNKRKHARQQLDSYRGDDREGIVIYCHQRMLTEHFDYCVFGHRHTPLVRSIGAATTYLNTGDFLTHRTFASYDPAGDSLVLHDLENPQSS